MNMQLTRENLKKIKAQAGIDIPDDKLFELPEKGLQFGTGILLRGLPDYFIDKANKQGFFNGRIVVVKSTSKGGVNEFGAQDGLFTHFVKGIEDGEKIDNLVQEGFVPLIKKARGFIRYYWLDTGDGEGASFGVFSDQAGADESIQLAANFVKEHMSTLLVQKPEVIEGPVKAHD